MFYLVRIVLVYNAIGLASFDLFDDINFDDWFATHLVTELTINTPMYVTF